MFTTINDTPYTGTTVLLPDHEGTRSAVAIIKATCEFAIDGSVRVADHQIPLCYGDGYLGEPGKSSVRYPSDMVYEKQGTDIAVNGHVYAPGGHPVTECPAMVQVGRLRKILTIQGDRTFKSVAGFTTRTRPQPFVRMPLCYERAFGGKDTSHPDPKHHGVFMENPIGKGFRAYRSKQAVHGWALPNIEDMENRIQTPSDRPAPAGFGCIPPNWEPRLSCAGTLDDAWKNNLMPLPPPDADIRCHNAAAPGLVSETPLHGRETVTLVNLYPHQDKVTFTLPGLSLTAAFTFDDETVKPSPVLDTLIIEPDDSRIVLVSRASTGKRLPLSQLRQVRLYENR